MNEKFTNFTPYIILILGVSIYWLTAFPTITWWESSEYSAAAVCLGITGAPGSIILTALGWLAVKIIPLNPALDLNLFAGLIGALTVYASFLLWREIQRWHNDNLYDLGPIENCALIITSLIIMCSSSLWEYSTIFAPYILTALFTVLILWVLLKWWTAADSEISWKYIFAITLLLGVDFSVHRTNAVLIPGIIVLMLVRNYKLIKSLKTYLAAFLGVMLGLSAQLLYIPMSLRDPMMNLGETNDIQRWWDFISLIQYGGGFLLDIIARKAPFWSYQVPYYFKIFGGQFCFLDKSSIVLGFVPAILGILGIAYLITLNKKLGWTLLIFFVLTVAVSIINFNVPENYFRTIDRHYLPTFVIFAVFIFAGVCFLFELLKKINGKTKVVTTSILILVLVFTFLVQLNRNLPSRNNSNNRIAYNHARNILESVDRGGILFSNGDNNLFPELYVQIGEGFRSDITGCNLSLLNLDWYLKQQERHDKNFPSVGKKLETCNAFRPKWKIANCEIPLDSSVQREYHTSTRLVNFSLPAIRNDSSVWPQDIALFDIIRANRWRRPIYFIKLGLDAELNEWLRTYLVDEGLVFKLVPDSSTKTNIEAVEDHIRKYNLEGYDNNSVHLEDASLDIGNFYYGIFLDLINDKLRKHEINNAKKYYNEMIDKLPVERLRPDKEVLKEINEIKVQLCSH